ncbi:hypothetical protein E6P09_17425 (plasmid) [Haloferax mediterranei ATCC 33500]|uniref:DUF8068 domain-containing protein n=1 Tax=Haloferax mediterranei (strain ATCC 33500 / DSM 1411 / JCM 8866 / NBRC 14739 / NCIMB 2177 / R-4) TaxID=523841 RepID=I3R9M5_HALMT|nr:hypothetical protein [Haloferax mediterranei]AFK20935.1 hypothetical protein HFX_5100 [Haloferax mediterranei ATCC 33500]AHZ24196.1 hypothetical protein BM92_18510 [Haloferax mediterranei ATCC 33500]EMA05275.1 hypothetical protein C439_00710 [Haloferax mediterranei ATCC 33500]MDX5989922.1 hypothetical protein [Haloferax mediterranei ATCC 33500]QCQ77114.1 hypothetical protein E6P09_17425 [Haloferax mediterranei ATCC 33500]
MSNQQSETASDAGSRLAAAATRFSSDSAVPTQTLSGAVGLAPIALITLYRFVYNVPGGLPDGVPEFVAQLYPFAIVGPAVAGFILAATAQTVGERVGLAFIGGFSLVSLASPTAWYPAAVGTTVGGCLVVWTRLARLRQTKDTKAVVHAAPAGLLVGGAVVSLAATAGISPATLRPLGSGIALVAVGMTPAIVGWDRTSLFIGAGAGILTLGFATSVPYVAGAVFLVGGGVVGAPLGLVVLGVGGGVSGLVYGLRESRVAGAFGAALLLASGVPSTLLRAAGVLVAVALFTTAVGSHATVERGETL